MQEKAARHTFTLSNSSSKSMVNTICVCGAGTMGSGIAQVCAQAGYYTIVYERDLSILERARIGIAQSLQKLVEKNKLTEFEKNKIFQQIYFTNDLHHCLADVIIEAIVENVAAKIALFNRLAEINHSETVFATNTSSLSVTDIAKEVMSPCRVIGMHFFNPAALMKLVEVTETIYTNEETTATIMLLTQQLNKVPVRCKDSPGFIVNRVARTFYLESLKLATENNISIESIDALLEDTGFKMGPFKLMDLIGNDINYAVSCAVYEQLGRPERLKPSRVQQEKVQKGELGKKTGKGYYQY